MTEVVSNQTGVPHRVVVVRDHLGVDLLLKLTSTRCMAPFMRTEHTLGTAAAELEMPASTLAYYVQRFVRAGLLEVVRLEPRAGKPIPVYRATADEFHIPFDAMPPGKRDEFLHGSRHRILDRFATAMERQIMRRRDSGLRVLPHPVRGVAIDFLDNDQLADVGATEWWGAIHLSDEEALAMRDELQAVVAKYADDRPSAGRRTYISMVGLAPDTRR
ncbi:MAG: hypothetical protein ACOYMR_05415 [Ilumatobacteraceae bacterium]